MAQAIAGGAIEQGVLSPQDIIASDPSDENRGVFAEWGWHVDMIDGPPDARELHPAAAPGPYHAPRRQAPIPGVLPLMVFLSGVLAVVLVTALLTMLGRWT